LDIKEKKLAHQICCRCGKNAFMPFLCREHNKELESLTKRFPEFQDWISDMYVENLSIEEILRELRKRTLELYSEIAQFEEELNQELVRKFSEAIKEMV